MYIPGTLNIEGFTQDKTEVTHLLDAHAAATVTSVALLCHGVRNKVVNERVTEASSLRRRGKQGSTFSCSLLRVIPIRPTTYHQTQRYLVNWASKSSHFRRFTT